MRNFKYIIFFFSCLLIASCERDYLKPKQFDPNTPVSFSQDVIPIFTENCTQAGCHNSGGETPNLIPSKGYDQLLGLGYVDTTNAEASVLYLRMNSNYKSMPPIGKISNEKTGKILAWIKQGAKNN